MNSIRTIAAAITVGSGVLLTSCSETSAPTQQENSQSEETVEIIPFDVKFQTEPNRVEAIGTARARVFAELYPKTGGEVSSVSFKAGDFVKAGQTLLQLDSREENLAVRRAQINLKNAEQLLDRYNRIDVPGAISESQIEEAQTALDAAQVELDLARNALSERTVRAPFSGHIGFTQLDKGARVTPQTEIARLDDRSDIYVDFDASEQVFSSLKAGETLAVEPFALNGKSYDAVIETIDSGIDPQERSFSVRTVIDNEADDLRPGMSFRIGFDLPGQRYPAIPEAAIVWGGDGAYLWAVKDGKATRTSVTIIARREGIVLVKAPLEEGSQIIAEGVQKVREGTPVKRVRTSANSGSSDASNSARPK